VDTIYLDRNENQYGPSPLCFKAVREARLEHLSLYSRAYMHGKKGALSERLSYELGIPEDQILLSYGSEDMLKQVVHCYLRKDEVILLPSQSWWYYKSVAKEVSGHEEYYPIRERNGLFEHDEKEILRLYDRFQPRVILIASPNNPTGNSISTEALRRILEHCTKAVVVLDEAYYGFADNGANHQADLLANHDRLLVLRTFSKYFALAGLRIGYACAGKDLEQLVAFSARYLGYNQLSEAIAAAALNDPEYYANTARKMRRDMQRYVRELSMIRGFVPYPSDANFLLVRYPANTKKELKSGLEERGVVIKFLEDPGLTDCIRITIGTTEQNSRVLDAFRQVATDVLHLPVELSENA
jgi:histidinol-phosphate aminotransferase